MPTSVSFRIALLLAPCLLAGCLGSRTTVGTAAKSTPTNEQVATSTATADNPTDVVTANAGESEESFWQNSWLDRLKRAPRIPLPLTAIEEPSEVAQGSYDQLDELKL